MSDETWDRITTLADIEKLEEWVANDSTYRSALEKHLRVTCVALRRAWLERDQARAERDEALASLRHARIDGIRQHLNLGRMDEAKP